MPRTIMKEFDHRAAGVKVRLSMGFDGDVPTFYALEKITGLNLALDDPNCGKVEFNVQAPTPACYEQLAKEFREIVSTML